MYKFICHKIFTRVLIPVEHVLLVCMHLCMCTSSNRRPSSTTSIVCLY